MKVFDVAKILLDSRYSKNSLFLSGDTRSKIGEDGVQIALRRGWITVDESFSALKITLDNTKLRDLVLSAEGNIDEVVCEAKKISATRVLDLYHSENCEKTKLFEDAIPKVGDPVIVTQDGQSYAATIRTINPDGTYALNFGEKQPKGVKASYSKDEINSDQPEEAVKSNSTPNTPTASAFQSGPRAPGLGR